MSAAMIALPAWPSLVFASFAGTLLYLARSSLPFSWHLRVLLPYVVARWRASKGDKKAGGKAMEGHPRLRLDVLPLGRDPFADSFSMRFKATIDECDFMGHLSNSSYPKNLDIARSNYATRCLLLFSADGGWIALGSVTFQFLREIPVLARYEIRSSIQTWDDKWLYLKNEFVSRDKHGNEVLHCVSISKHCCKVGRKTIPPWFALVYSGYTPASSPDRMDNWTRSQALRLRLQEKGGRNSNPIRAIKPCRGDELPLEEWMSPSAWNVEGWTEACSKRKAEMRQYY